MKAFLQGCSILLLLCSAAAHAQLYKWVGPDGKVTYSDVPPRSNAAKVENKALAVGEAGGSNLPFELAEAVKAHPVTLYTTRDCAACDEARKFLSERGIPFSEKTVTTNDDIAQYKQAGGEGQLPMMTVGRNKEKGFEAGAWGNVLTAAGYPETSKLPKTYRNPPAQAAAPAPRSVSITGNKTAETSASRPVVTDLPPAIGNAPPGFRF
ncbi:glutaredoxin family protein [Noviherbaspirillum saxi]|uniref:Glutaredoxin family protein n=1 Tax=Noviherbaspirillum saxi TaxID=2320863 RepID=A0A3A3FPP1_9BURK|nr:glutaredoxin family protein [Noviherbaspirillum saxi]RJF97986.1 glutaredoxin family protein [Noviherbaspirillum saxi]